LQSSARKVVHAGLKELKTPSLIRNRSQTVKIWVLNIRFKEKSIYISVSKTFLCSLASLLISGGGRLLDLQAKLDSKNWQWICLEQMD